jgi:hypothetical protein
MKRILLIAVVTLSLTSCKDVLYTGRYGNVNDTRVVLDQANYKMLGHFKGMASGLKFSMNIKNREGVLSLAKTNMLENIKAAGIDLNGRSIAFVNVTTDVVQNTNRLIATVTADVIEFTN